MSFTPTCTKMHLKFFVSTLFLKVCFFCLRRLHLGGGYIWKAACNHPFSTCLTIESPRMRVVGWTGVKCRSLWVATFLVLWFDHFILSVSSLGNSSPKSLRHSSLFWSLRGWGSGTISTVVVWLYSQLYRSGYIWVYRCQGHFWPCSIFKIY